MKFKLLVVTLIVFQVSYSQNFKFGKVSKEELLQKEHPLEPSANAAILYREKKSIFEIDQSLDFSLTTEVYERIKIYNKEGYEWASNYANVYKNESISNLKGNTDYIGDDDKVVIVKLSKT